MAIIRKSKKLLILFSICAFTFILGINILAQSSSESETVDPSNVPNCTWVCDSIEMSPGDDPEDLLVCKGSDKVPSESDSNAEKAALVNPIITKTEICEEDTSRTRTVNIHKNDLTWTLTPDPATLVDTPGEYDINLIGSYEEDTECSISHTYTFKLTVINVILTKVNFNDHKLLLDNNTNFEDQGRRYKSPEWELVGTNEPFTLTMDTKNKVALTIRVTPDNTPEMKYTVKGVGPVGFNYNDEITLKGGLNENVIIESTDKLEKKITSVKKEIEWTFTCEGGGEYEATTGPHKYYVLAGSPRSNFVTEKRVATVVKICEGLNKPHDCAKKIHETVDDFFNGSVGLEPDPIWKLYEGDGECDCPGISNLIRVSIDIIGQPAGSVRLVYPWLNRTVYEGGFPKRNPNNNHEVMQYIDNGNNTNNFEACFYYTASNTIRYYAPGTGKNFPTAKEVMEAVCKYTVWFNLTSQSTRLAPEGWKPTP